ncbi:MAG: asparagine synthase (glutamine-hydrolyzing) [Candidatus Omnitrophica bacterium]|nr:asparagine synthase (glutamine-hydrolyzing) [Candidatus Omnitrophota bacterium]
MCGICGVADFDGLPPEDLPAVEQMREAMRHRGPDDAGVYHDPSAALGVRRLSVIDVAGGHQPLANEDQTVWAVLNGEIYNYRVLREELENQGHRFATRSDTEVVVHLYETHGDRFVERLQGMFGLAIWDGRRRRLLLARDRIGIKPLYYAAIGRRLLFASELKALWRHPQITREVDLVALDAYLQQGYIPAPRSIIQRVSKLLPGHLLTADAEGHRLTRYWELPEPTVATRLSLPDVETQLRDLAANAVRSHLVSDVPVGVLLSGGLDSTWVLALAARHAARPLPAFTIGFEDPSFDETASAALAANAFGVPHVVERLTPAATLGALTAVVGAMDEPLADPSLVPTWHLARLARTQVTVALGGDGGDELFGGYPTYPAHRMAERYQRLPGVVRERWIPRWVGRLPVSHRNFSADFVARRFVQGASLPTADRHYAWMGLLEAGERERLWRPAHGTAVLEGDAWPREPIADHGDPADAAMRLDLHTYLVDDLLAKADRMSMAHGLELRVPLLDTALVEFAARLPASQKLRGFQTKWLIRRALRGLAPTALSRRPKKGFGIPVAAWLCGPLRALAEEQLAPARLTRRGWWDPARVQQLLQDHWARRRNHGRLLWALLMFELWCERHLEGTDVS